MGITRARDYLVFPTRKNATRWLNRTWHEGNPEMPTLDEHSGETQWEWKNNIIYKDTLVEMFPKEFPHAERVVEEVFCLKERKGKNKKHIAYQIDLTQETFPNIKAKVGATTQYGATIPIKEDVDEYQLAKMAKAYLIADHLEYDISERIAICLLYTSPSP